MMHAQERRHPRRPGAMLMLLAMLTSAGTMLMAPTPALATDGAGRKESVAPSRAIASALSPQMRERVREIIDEACVFCHGERGEASNPIYPRLAAQNRAYLERQLKLFRSGARKSDIMNEQAADLTDAEIAALAAWFSSQPPLAHELAPDERERGLWQVGRYVFRYGDPFEDIPPCTTCHGADARGSRTLPRLAGQHRKYIVNQLLAFHKGERQTDNAMMRHIAKNLSRLAMEGVALYLSTLKPEAATDGAATDDAATDDTATNGPADAAGK